MQMLKGEPLFPKKSNYNQYPYLTEDIETEILIIGGGVTGALALWYFSEKAIPCVLIDANRFSMRSTSITTSLLQYELDDNFRDLMKNEKISKVERSYKIGVDALVELENIVNKLGNHCEYLKNDCLLMTKNLFEVKQIKDEYEARKAMGLDVIFLDENDKLFPFEIKAGVYSKNGGARLNPCMFTNQLLESSQKNNVRLFENTKAVSFSYTDSNVIVKTQYENSIVAKKVVVATGYDVSAFTDKEFCKKFVTYNIVTKPIKNLDDFKLLVRDNKTTYHYFRQTNDKRIILGGEDTVFKQSEIDEKTSNKKYEKLLNYLQDLFPQSKEFIEIDTSYCGVFGTTKDNLGVMGSDEKNDKILFCLGYGANGILFAIMGAKMLAEQYVGNIQKDLDLFSPNRSSL